MPEIKCKDLSSTLVPLREKKKGRTPILFLEKEENGALSHMDKAYVKRVRHVFGV
jgi:hypothetical protein